MDANAELDRRVVEKKGAVTESRIAKERTDFSRKTNEERNGSFQVCGICV